MPALICLALSGCTEKRGEAIVLEKEHIAAQETPLPAAPGDSPSTAETATTREIRPDEIAVDGYVMKKGARGTGRDPRAMTHEQWLVKVRLMDDGRILNATAGREQFEKLNAGDRVSVTYHVGKYTGTVWGAELK